MPRKRTSTKRRKIPSVEDWQLHFLLTGEEPDTQELDINPFKALVFCHAQVNEPPERFGNVEPWFKTWERVKDDPLVTKWRQQHGKTYAEQILEQYAK